MDTDKLKHGDLFAIPLWSELGFGYGKLLLGNALTANCRKRDTFIKVYDYFTEGVKQNMDRDFFRNQRLFLDPFILTGQPKLKGVHKWIPLGAAPIYPEDDYVPDYVAIDYFDSSTISPDEPMFVLKAGNLNSGANEFFPYRRVKHLPIHRGRNADAISLFITFEWMKRNGKKPEDYIQFEDGLDVKKTILYEVNHMLIDFRQVPDEIKGKPAPEIKQN